MTTANNGVYSLEPRISPQDVASYIRHCLRPARGLEHGHLDLLIEMADDSLVWAATACRYIMAGNEFHAMALRHRRLEKTINSDGSFDALYTLIMTECVNGNDNEVLLRTLGLLALQIPGTTVNFIGLISGIPKMYFPPGFSLSGLRQTTSPVWRLSPLFSSFEDVPAALTIVLWHSSFRDFLLRSSARDL